MDRNVPRRIINLQQSFRVIGWFISLIGAATIVAAWLYPGSSLCVALGWTSVALFHAALKIRAHRIKRLFCAGVLTYLGGFHWLLSTITDFGGFPLIAGLAIFLLFAVGSAVQFAIWAFSWSLLPNLLDKLGMRTAVAWLIAHHFWIKIFPWDFGHTQLAFVPLAQLAGILGVTGITFLMMWLVETLTERKRVTLLARSAALLSLVATLGYGVWIQDALSREQGHPLKTVMIQGNVSLQRKHDVSFFTVNREQYLKTSSTVAERDSLIIWPESTITDFIPDTTSNAKSSSILPFLNNGSAFLVGGLTYLSRAEFFNSSLLIRPDGSLDSPYHKIILMPFGEYTPLSSLFPWLQDINSTAGKFSAGTAPKVLSFNLSDERPVKLSPIICYEDVVPLLAREATARGAQLLVNQSNDAWFGNTVAPYQHHMIASFRAIENRRYLLRSTNTGLTAVVDPMGRTLASLLPFTESVLPMEVSLLSYKSTYTKLPIYLIWLIVSAIAALYVVAARIRLGRNPL